MIVGSPCILKTAFCRHLTFARSYPLSIVLVHRFLAPPVSESLLPCLIFSTCTFLTHRFHPLGTAAELAYLARALPLQ